LFAATSPKATHRVARSRSDLVEKRQARWFMAMVGCATCGGLAAREPVSSPKTKGAVSEVLLQSTRSWDGETYRAYAQGQPEISVLRIDIPPHSALAWHYHPVINAAYVLTGKLFVEKKSDGLKREVNAGEVLPEMVNALHRGYTGDQSATLLVFYAGVQGTPVTVKASE
jgi:quercetin dioxygenase-like cupin family protein